MAIKITGFCALILICIMLFVSGCTYFLEKNLFPARMIEPNTNLNFSLNFKEIFIDTLDGAKLNAVLFEAKDPKGVVLHFHGNGENILDMESVARPFITRNYNFLAMDYRTYGKSTGELSEKSLFSDGFLFLKYLEDQGWKQSEIILYGRSIGTGIATKVASESNVSALILYSPYYSMKSLISEKVPFLPVDIILKYPLESAAYMQYVTCPVLILHGDSDPVIPLSSAEKLSKIRGKIVVFKDGNHDNLIQFPEFWSQVDNLLLSL